MTGNAQPDLLHSLPASPAFRPDPEAVRRRLQDLLDIARQADSLPWDARRTRVNSLLFHQMAEWLPPAERDRLRAQFTAEMARLTAQRG